MNKVAFTLSYSALKMFGKQLYSNVGSAISELVANGLDAKAEKIYLTVDARDKTNAYVEVYDEGKGMSPEDISDHYIKIGYNKRKHEAGLNDGNTLGRKGIGKLAALFLSDCFIIATKKSNSTLTCWKLDVTGLDDDATPELVQIDSQILKDLSSFKKLTSIGHGTIISLFHVNLKGLGEKAFESLSQRLSNLFLYDKLKQKILINIIEKDSDIDKFVPVTKNIAFKNMAYILTSDTGYVKECVGNKFKVSYKTKTEVEKKLEEETEVVTFSKENVKFEGEQEFWGKKKKFKLDGWVGIHSTIEGDAAKENDDRYLKNQFYNPNQLRVYVRNKLALANMIEYLGITRAFVNYIEGEVSFDILDDDELEDIATAGRQDFNTQDPRFVLLKELLIKIGNLLVAKRQQLADKISEKKKKADTDISSKSKAVFKKEVREELDKIEALPESQKEVIEQIVTSKIEGVANIETKAEHTVFLSHSSKDKIFSDFIFNYLIHLGFNGDSKKAGCEIFYSSNGLDSNNLKPLSALIKDYIIHKKNDILFLTSNNFGSSEYCLFEGGAAWATKSVGDYKILALTYDSIPQFLTNGKSEAVLNIKGLDDLKMDKAKYCHIVDALNRIINHLNKNRLINDEAAVPNIPEPEFPDKVELKRLGKTMEDYMDKEILTYWETYVVDQGGDYFTDETENPDVA